LAIFTLFNAIGFEKENNLTAHEYYFDIEQWT